MAYYLTIEKRKGVYTPLDITKSKYFVRNSNLKGSGATLAEIDAFTMMFDNERELRGALFREGFVDLRNAGRSLSIRNKIKGKYYKVTYDFLYKKDLDFISEPERIIKRIENKLAIGDFRFIEKYANTFVNFHDCSSTAPEVREFAKASIRDEIKSKHFNDLDENLDNPLTRMTKLLIYDYYQFPSGRIEYKSSIKYHNLHSVIAFTNHYDKKYEEEIIELEEIENQTSLFEPKVKKRVKDKNIEGQLSLFE